MAGNDDDSLRDLDARRSFMFWVAALMALGSAVNRLVGGGHPHEMRWEFASAVICGATGWLTRHPSHRVRNTAMATMAVFFLVTTPLVSMSSDSPTVTLVMLALPLAMTTIFFERRAVVASISGTGLLVNMVVLAWQHWSPMDLLHAAVSMTALYGAGLFGAFELARMRQRERSHEAARRKGLAAQLQSERLVVLGTLAAGVAHEINNPLAYVVTNLEFLEHDAPSDPVELAEVWSETNEGLKRIAAIVSDLKCVAHAGPRGVDSLRLDGLLRQTARLASLRTRGRINLVVELQSELPACVADEQRLGQVLLNLVVNACDALDERRPEEPKIRLSVSRALDRVLVAIDDNGPGVSPEVRAQLFTPFFTTKPVGVGTGLGLALSREYLESFGAHVSCEDSPWGGARFVVSLAVAS